MTQSPEVLRTILETLPYSVFWKDVNSVYLGCNKPFAECAGLADPRDIIGLNDYDLPWKREESDAYRADDALVMKSGVPKLHIIETQKNSAGQFTWLDTSKVPLRDKNGNIMGVLGIYADITEQKSNEIELIKTKDYLYQAINAIASGFVVYDQEDRFVLCNEQYKAMYPEVRELMNPGIGYRELLEHYAERKKDLLKPGETPADWVDARLEKHHRHAKDWIQELPDSIVKVSDRITSDGSIVSLRTDITAERKTAADLKLAKEKAESASKTKSRFLANMSHEIRTPMSGILGMAELLMEGQLSEEQHEYVEAILKSSQSLIRIVNDILDLSKIEANRIEIVQSEFRLLELFEEVLATFSAVAHERNITILLECDQPLENVWVLADHGRLAQIVSNLLGNAIKFTPNEGWIVIQLASQAGSKDKCCFRVSVTDTGIGIDPENLERIFSPFSQADETTTRRFGGTGLGLTISQRLAKLLRSKIQVHSKVNCGSVFFLELTFPRVCAAETASGEPDHIEFEKWLLGKRILLAEDNLINQKLVTKLLTNAGLEVSVASNGRDALKMFSEQAFDLVLTDIQMPIMDGEELTRILKVEHQSQVPIVALTAHAMKGDRENFLALGMDDYVSKPISRTELLEVLAKVLEAKNAKLSLI